MRIAVIGPGAIGTIVAGLLAHAGEDVWLLHRREDAAARIDEEGVRIEDRETNRTIRASVPATTDASRVGSADLVVVLVRSHQTIEAVEGHAGCIGENTRVLSLQNGIANHHRLREHLGADRVVSGITRQSGSLVAPGRVVRTGDRESVIGGADRAFAESVAEVFTGAGLETRVVDDPLSAIWHKQILAGGLKPVAALTGLSNGAILRDDALAEVVAGVMREMGAVAAARGHPIDAEELYEYISETKRESEHVSSMRQDVERERRTEIDDVNGAVVDLAESMNDVDVTINATLTALVRGLERSYLDDR